MVIGKDKVVLRKIISEYTENIRNIQTEIENRN